MVSLRLDSNRLSSGLREPQPQPAAAAVALALALSLGFGCAAEPLVDGSERAIVDGTFEEGRPEVVFIALFAGGGLGQCTGTLIAPRVVLTAKHCVRNGSQDAAAPARNFRVFIGSSQRSFTEQLSVSEVRAAPGSWDIQDATDVATLILSSPAQGAEPAEVSFDSPFRLQATTLTSVGFGQTPSGSTGTKMTQNTTMDFVQGNFIFVRPSICQGDSGGPLFGEDGRVWGVASFGYSNDGSQPRCGSPGAYNALNLHREFIEDSIEASGLCIPSEEVCNGVDDDCNEQIDEGCLDLGAECERDDQCYGGLCAAAEGDVARCTTGCNPLAPTEGCGGGMHCERRADNFCEGVCVSGEAGMLPIEAECTSHTECATAFCVDPGDGRQRCLAPCVGGGNVCLSGEACAAAIGSCGACVAAEIVRGTRGPGEPCLEDTDCSTNFCFHDEGLSYCTNTCTDDDSCADEVVESGSSMSFHCRDEACVQGPREDLGGHCVVNADCGSGICAAADNGNRWCTRFCSDTNPCASGFACTTLADGNSICAPELGLVGDTCDGAGDCLTGLCARGTGAGDICTRLCGPDQPCAPGYECTRIGDGTEAVCVPPSVDEEGTRDGCQAGGTPSAFGLLAMLGLFVRRRRH